MLTENDLLQRLLQLVFPVEIFEHFTTRDRALVLHLHQRKKDGIALNFLSQSGIVNPGYTHTASFAEFIKRNQQISLSSAGMNTVTKVKKQYQRLMDYCNELEQEKGTLIDEIHLLKRQLKEIQEDK